MTVLYIQIVLNNDPCIKLLGKKKSLEKKVLTLSKEEEVSGNHGKAATPELG